MGQEGRAFRLGLLKGLQSHHSASCSRAGGCLLPSGFLLGGPTSPSTLTASAPDPKAPVASWAACCRGGPSCCVYMATRTLWKG